MKGLKDWKTEDLERNNSSTSSQTEKAWMDFCHFPCRMFGLRPQEILNWFYFLGEKNGPLSFYHRDTKDPP